MTACTCRFQKQYTNAKFSCVRSSMSSTVKSKCRIATLMLTEDMIQNRSGYFNITQRAGYSTTIELINLVKACKPLTCRSPKLSMSSYTVLTTHNCILATSEICDALSFSHLLSLCNLSSLLMDSLIYTSCSEHHHSISQINVSQIPLQILCTLAPRPRFTIIHHNYISQQLPQLLYCILLHAWGD